MTSPLAGGAGRRFCVSAFCSEFFQLKEYRMCRVLPYLKVKKYNLRLKLEICPTDDSRTTGVRLMKCQSYTDHLASFGRSYIKGISLQKLLFIQLFWRNRYAKLQNLLVLLKIDVLIFIYRER